ncbi:MAG: tetratricopeptide repeat protein [Phycisphaerales bacterium]
MKLRKVLHMMVVLFSIVLMQGNVMAGWDANSLYNQAYQFESDGRYDEAVAAYNMVLADFPKSIQAGPAYANYRLKYIACKRALAAGDIATARDNAEKIKALNGPGMAGALYWAGYLFHAKFYFDDALAFYEKVIADFPKDVMAGPDYTLFRVKFIGCKKALEAGEIEAAKAIAKEIMQLPCSEENKPEQLYGTGWEFETVSLSSMANSQQAEINDTFDTAKSFYQGIINRYSKSAYLERAKAHMDVLEIFSAIDNGDNAAAKSKVEQLKAKIGSKAELVDILYFIGLKYYVVGQRSGKTENFNESTAMMENYISTAKPQGTCKADAYYMMGLNYQAMEDYAKAAEAFDKAYQADAKHQYADYCLFAAGNCYEKLAEKKVMSEDESKKMTASYYNKLLEAYPNSQGAYYVREWLANNSK